MSKSKMHRSASAWLGVVTGALWLAGCQQLPVYLSDDNQVLPPQPAEGLVERQSSPIVDVPMPVGFVIVESKSRSFATAEDGRYVEHYYQGRASKADTLAFYRQMLAQHQWRLISEQNQGGAIAQSYRKGSEMLDLRIDNPRDVTTVVIVIRSRNGKTVLVPRPVSPAPAARPTVP